LVVNIPPAPHQGSHPTTGIFSWSVVDWLWWGETDVSELRPLQAYCSSPVDCNVDHGTMVSTAANC
jgi:hypothetical protein